MGKIVKIIFGALTLILFSAFLFFLYKELKPSKPLIEIETLPEIERKPVAITEEATETIEEKIFEEEREIAVTKVSLEPTPQQLIDKVLLYPKIDYPNIYGYDPESKTIKVYNLEDKTFNEISKIENLKFLEFSRDNLRILFKSGHFYLLDTLRDKLIKLPTVTNKAFFKEDNIYLFLKSLGNNYLAVYEENIKKIIDIFIQNPNFDYLKDSIIFYEDLKYTQASPLYLINLHKKEKEQLLTPKINLSVITNKDDLIFASFLQEGWKGVLLNKEGKIIFEFNFGTLKEKCTFKKYLVCGVPYEQNYYKLEDWYYYKKIFDDRLIIFDPLEKKIKYYDLIKGFDVISPELTPLGIIFFNRNDAKLYVVPIEQFSL